MRKYCRLHPNSTNHTTDECRALARILSRSQQTRPQRVNAQQGGANMITNEPNANIQFTPEEYEIFKNTFLTAPEEEPTSGELHLNDEGLDRNGKYALDSGAYPSHVKFPHPFMNPLTTEKTTRTASDQAVGMTHSGTIRVPTDDETLHVPNIMASPEIT